MKAIIEKGLKSLYSGHPVRMHMPGHKGKLRHFKYDVTEVNGADTLQDPQGIIRMAQEKIADCRGAEEAFFLVGGSTSGIQAAVFSALGPGDKILIPRNAHYSVYSALALTGAEAVIYEPQADYPGMRVSKEDILEALEETPEARAVLVTSPDYYGSISDLEGIHQVTSEREIPLIVDAAHGAHLKYSGIKDAVGSGADYVIESVHKTLSAPTQGGILYTQGLADNRRVQRALNLFQTSSPSYILLSGIEKAIDEAEVSGEERFKRIYAAHDALEEALAGSAVRLYSPEGDYDKSKFVFIVPDAAEVAERLTRDYNIIPEFAAGDILLCMSGIKTSQRDLNRLLGSIKEISKTLESGDEPEVQSVALEMEMDIREALQREDERVDLNSAPGRISSDFIIPYPPGIPVAVPGSKITAEVVEAIGSYLRGGASVRGLRDGVNVIKEET